MASLIYDSALYDALTGAIDFGGDAFRVMLVGPGYVPDAALHARRSDVGDEAAGRGYEAGGAAVAVGAGRRRGGGTEVSLGGAVWPRAQLSAAGAVYYKARGGLASADELVAYIDFGGLVVATNGDFLLERSVLELAADSNPEPRP